MTNLLASIDILSDSVLLIKEYGEEDIMFLSRKEVINMAKEICRTSDRPWRKDDLVREITSRFTEKNRLFLKPLIANLIRPNVDYDEYVRRLVDSKFKKIRLRDHNFTLIKLKPAA